VGEPRVPPRRMIGSANGARIGITGLGVHVPERVVTNDDLAQYVETSDEWIVERTGIHERRMITEDQALTDIALPAARAALDDAGATADDIDLLICATVTPDMMFPTASALMADTLGAEKAAAYDLLAGCTGFMYALAQAYGMLASGLSRRALVVGGDVLSSILDWTDRSTLVLFGDGAGAVVVEATMGDGSIQDHGVLAARLRSDGRHRSKLYVDGGPSSNGQVGHLRMDGKEVFKLAVGVVPQILHDTLEDVGLPFEAIDWFVPHQANRRIIDATAEKLGIPTSKVVLTVDLHANTSAASIPLALDVAVKDGRIKTGDMVLLEAMGGGFTWGAALIRW